MELQENISKLNELKEMQRGSIVDGYGLGLFNGIELALSIMEGRDPVFEDVTAIKK